MYPGAQIEAALRSVGPYIDVYHMDGYRQRIYTYSLALSADVKDICVKNIPFYPVSSDESNPVTISYKIRGLSDTVEIYRLEDSVQSIKVLSETQLTDISEGELWDEHNWVWDGCDDNDNVVPPGIYPIAVTMELMRLEPSEIAGRYTTRNSLLSAYLKDAAPAISGSTAVFEYITWSTDARQWPYRPGPDGWPLSKVYLNLYDDEFRFIKRLLFKKETPVGEWQPVDWDFSAYAAGDYYYTIYAQDDRDIQSHVRGGKFEVPEHEIMGEPDPYPMSDPDIGWENEGAIVRVVSVLDLAVDSNNDGIVDMEYDNFIEKEEPGFVLWANDDNDHWDVNSKYWSEDRTTARGRKGEPDNANDTINGIHDLEDFFSMRLQIPADSVEDEKFYLEGAPVRVFKKLFVNPEDANNPEKQNDYLNKLKVVKEQHQVDSLGTVGLDTDSRLEVRREDFTEDGVLWLIFEGLSEEGTYDLKFYREVGDIKIDEDTAKTIIKGVQDMYKFWNLRVSRRENAKGFDIYNPDALVLSSGEYYSENPDKMLVFFHGYSVNINGARQWFNTTYKRLYRAGYRGGFSGVTWEGDEKLATFFNTNWVNAFRVAELAKKIIVRIKNQWGNGQITLGAHSLGNLVVLAAVRKMAYEGLSDIVNKVIHLQAAVPANVYNEIKSEDYFDSSFRPNFVVCPKAINSWSKTDEILSVFNKVMKLNGWTTPDYKSGYVFGPPPFWEKMSNARAMGCRTAALAFPSGEQTYFRDWRVSRESELEQEEKDIDIRAPYQIRDHSSMKDEYYFDVADFFEKLVKKQIK